MARLPRYVLPGHPQHIIQRGNNRSIIFVTEDDFEFYRECLICASVEHDVQVHAYVFMTNHVHLLMTPNTVDGLSKVMQSVGRRYVQYFNFRHQRTGTLWEGRYRATLIDTERYLLTCYRYIELNPVRANMVPRPEMYRWSSFRCNAQGFSDELISPHSLYKALATAQNERLVAYGALFERDIAPELLDSIRNATNKAWLLGGDRFKNEIELLINRRPERLPTGGDRRSDNFRAGD